MALSPLRDNYTFKSANLLKELVPPKSIIETYLLYSGEIELFMATSGRLVIAHTNKYPVYEFWWAVTQAPKRIAAMAEDIYPKLEDEMFETLQEKWYTYNDPVYRSALFFILNRCSELGAASCGIVDRSGYNPISISRLKNLDTTNIYMVLDKHHELENNINTEIKSDIKIFPVGKYTNNLLDRNMSHAIDIPHVNNHKLIEKLKYAEYKWVVIYKKHPAVFRLLKDYNQIMVNKFGRETRNIEMCDEVIIANF